MDARPSPLIRKDPDGLETEPGVRLRILVEVGTIFLGRFAKRGVEGLTYIILARHLGTSWRSSYSASALLSSRASGPPFAWTEVLCFIYLMMRSHPASYAKLLLAAGVSPSVPCGLKAFSLDKAQVPLIVLRLAVCGFWLILLWIEDNDRLAFRKLRAYLYKTA